MIKIYVRDCNGKREVWEFENEEKFSIFCLNNDDIDNDMYEIQVVIYDGHCVYSGLAGCYDGNGDITFEDLFGFFA